MGPTYTVDAACASSLIALEIAVQDLLTGQCDLAIAGGAQVTTPIPIFTLFCQLNALSHQQEIRPFDEKADGTILGEGIGINTWIASNTGASVGYGFAIPINSAKKAIEDFVSTGKVQYAWLGVQIQTPNDPIAAAPDAAVRGGM